jgi:5-methylcytosine-specific restriction protein A
MGKLKALPNRLASLKPALGFLPRLDPKSEASRTANAPWRAWYKTARWQKLRWSILARDLFTCQCGCGVTEVDTSKLVADHRRPHRGDERLFWDPGNLWTLRKTPCHDSWKQRIERADRRN